MGSNIPNVEIHIPGYRSFTQKNRLNSFSSFDEEFETFILFKHNLKIFKNFIIYTKSPF